MLDFHRRLLADEGRTLAYRRAIEQRVAAGDVVVDLGTGTGILAFFAAAAGARRVFAIDEHHIADAAQLLVRHAGLGERIEIFHERSGNVMLPERADLLVTETLGPLGLDENILGSVIDARQRLLRPGAALIPENVVVSIVPVEVTELYEREIAWWRARRYGLDVSPLAVLASNALYNVRIDAAAFIADPADVIAVDLASADCATAAGRASFVARRDGTLHGFTGWFTATLAPGIVLSNTYTNATHWEQTFLPLERPVAVTRGTPIELELTSFGGDRWLWRGAIGTSPGVRFAQSTSFAEPPCQKDAGTG